MKNPRIAKKEKRCKYKRSGVQCGLEIGHAGRCKFFCAGEYCQGYFFPANEIGHTWACVTGEVLGGPVVKA